MRCQNAVRRVEIMEDKKMNPIVRAQPVKFYIVLRAGEV